MPDSSKSRSHYTACLAAFDKWWADNANQFQRRQSVAWAIWRAAWYESLTQSEKRSLGADARSSRGEVAAAAVPERTSDDAPSSALGASPSLSSDKLDEAIAIVRKAMEPYDTEHGEDQYIVDLLVGIADDIAALKRTPSAERIAQLERELAEARAILAGSDAASLPNDYPLARMASDRMKEIAAAEDRYLSAVRGRADFRKAYRDERAKSTSSAGRNKTPCHVCNGTGAEMGDAPGLVISCRGPCRGTGYVESASRSIHEAVRAALLSQDLYQLLLDVQNGIFSPGQASIANCCIRKLDKARAEMYATDSQVKNG